MHEFLTDDEIGGFFYQLIEFIKNQRIGMIVTIAKKGTFLLNYMLKRDLPVVDEFKTLGIYISSDRKINKMDTYNIFHGKNILLFDDSVKTGSHFIHTTNYLRRKINNNMIIINEDFEFFYYAYIKCEHAIINENIDTNKLGVYQPSATIEDYFKFCHEESIFFQKNLIPTSIDLPILRAEIDDINKLSAVLKNQTDFTYRDTSFKIANEKFDLGILIIDDNDIKNVVKEFLISSICKIRFEYNDVKEKYDILFSPFALCDSIKYEELEKLYNNLFDTQIKNKTKAQMNSAFVKLYRYVVYLLSYMIGVKIKNRLIQHKIEINFDKSFNDYFCLDRKDMFMMKKAIYKYEKSGLNEFSYNDFSYSYKDNIKSSIMYSLEQIKIFLYDAVIRKKGDYSDNKDEKREIFDYGFVELHPLTQMCYNLSNKMNFIEALVAFLENFVMSNEIEFNFKNGWVERGLCSGEASFTILPIDDHLFYCGLTYYYNKVNKDFKLYKENYPLFIDKFNTFLKNEGFYDSNDITSAQFNYLSEYYGDVNERNLSFIIESKKYILQSRQGYNRFKYIKNWLEFMLESTDFTFNATK